MNNLNESILNLLKEKCEQDLCADPTFPTGYDIPTLHVELDKLYGIGKLSAKEIEQALNELVQSGQVTKLLSSYILSIYNNL